MLAGEVDVPSAVEETLAVKVTSAVVVKVTKDALLDFVEAAVVEAEVSEQDSVLVMLVESAELLRNGEMAMPRRSRVMSDSAQSASDEMLAMS